MARAVVPSDAAPKKKLYREGNPGERWWFTLLLLPTVLTAFVVYTEGDAIEAELEHDTQLALAEAGFTGTAVELDGRNAVIKVPTGQSPSVARQAAESVDGIGSVEIEHVARNAAEARACDDLESRLARTSGSVIRFAGSSTTLTGSNTSAVREIARLLVRCPTADVVASGYTDGSVLNGSTVSLRRAEAVRSALARAGIHASRVEVKGFGDSFPVSREDNAAARAANNRVTVTLVED